MNRRPSVIHHLADAENDLRSLLVVTIDTEEEGRWGGGYAREGNRCENIEHLGALAPLLDEFGVRPTWLVDYPVATDSRACTLLAEAAERWRGEVGAHLHPWCTPPYGEDDDAGITYASLLPARSQRAKLESLTGQIERAFGRRPTSYRAGRWGLSPVSVAILSDLGYRVDSSVTPLRWEDGRGGPCYLRAPSLPYLLSAEDVSVPGAGPLLEVPASIAMIGAIGRLLEPALRRLRPMRGLARLMEFLGRTWLRPSSLPERRLRRGTAELVRRGHPVLNVMFHSSELMPGASPYVRDAAQLRIFLARLRGIFEEAFRLGGVRAATLSETRGYLVGRREETT